MNIGFCCIFYASVCLWLVAQGKVLKHKEALTEISKNKWKQQYRHANGHKRDKIEKLNSEESMTEVYDDDDGETTNEKAKDYNIIHEKPLSSHETTTQDKAKNLPKSDHSEKLSNHYKYNGIRLGNMKKDFYVDTALRNDAKSTERGKSTLSIVLPVKENFIKISKDDLESKKSLFSNDISQLDVNEGKMRTTRPKAEDSKPNPRNPGIKKAPIANRVDKISKMKSSERHATNTLKINSLNGFNTVIEKPITSQKSSKSLKALNQSIGHNSSEVALTSDNAGSVNKLGEVSGSVQIPLKYNSGESIQNDKNIHNNIIPSKQAQKINDKKLQKIPTDGLLMDNEQNKNFTAGKVTYVNEVFLDDKINETTSQKGKDLDSILDKIFSTKWFLNLTDEYDKLPNITSLATTVSPQEHYSLKPGNITKVITVASNAQNDVKSLEDERKPEDNSTKILSSTLFLPVKEIVKPSKDNHKMTKKHFSNQISQHREIDVEDDAQNYAEIRTANVDQPSSKSTTEKTETWYSGKLVQLPKTKRINNETVGKQNKDSFSNSSEMSNWSLWSTCSATCGTNALRIRTRKCNSENTGITCDGKMVDWKPCIKAMVCPKANRSSTLQIVTTAANEMLHNVATANEDQESSLQWGKWSPCPNECGAKDIKIRRRICPGQRSSETGICNKSTMQWAWCKPDSHTCLKSTKYGVRKQADKITNENTNHSQFQDAKEPQNSSHLTIHSDQGIQFTKKCSTSPWSKWSLCSRTCGENSRKFRTRSCSCQENIVCEEPVINWRHCTLPACPGEENYGPWSKFSPCSKTCGGGWRKRVRHCISEKKHKKECDNDLLIGVRVCNTKKCLVKTNGYVTIDLMPHKDPEISCGFVPCEEFGCLDNAYSKCQADKNCDPVFFDLSGKIMHRCTDYERYFIKKPSTFCGYDPCSGSPCRTSFGNCFVDLKCRAISMGYGGSLIDCQRFMGLPYKQMFYSNSGNQAIQTGIYGKRSSLKN